LGKSVTVRRGDSDIVIVALGGILSEAVKAADILAAENIDVSIVNARFAKPIDDEIVSLFYNKKNIITVEEHYLACGFGSALLEAVAEKSRQLSQDISSAATGTIVPLGGPDRFIQVGSRRIQLDEMGTSAGRIAETVRVVVSETIHSE
jgi:1-deoxy-D-xylulose-5-phosphate synthase